MTISLAFLAPNLVQAAVEGACPVASASQICEMPRPHGPCNTRGSGSRRKALSSIGITAPGIEFFRPETGPRIRHIPPAGDQITKIARRRGRANAGLSRTVSVIRDSGTAWWRTQSKSNPSPPPNSLLTGKSTGNFAKNAVSVASETVNSGAVTGLSKRIPYSTEQGIILAEQGNLAREQGILPARIEIIAGWEFSDKELLGDVRFSNRPVWVKRFQTSIAAVSMSLTGSCFSSESAPGPFHYGIRGRGGTI